MVKTALGVLFETRTHVSRFEVLVDSGRWISEQALDVIDAFPTKPARVGGTEALLCARGHLYGDELGHSSPKDEFSVVGFTLVSEPTAEDRKSTRVNSSP